ncbi:MULTISPECIES: TonB-dependent receptor [unclassified Sphingobacterium]|uniref:SusC/RagA family TonB-linked outer membrane protein n=1 Tax=unclassified Sphingobacterium TaxID=2609468 RepID=UPI001405528B|nr:MULTISPECIES: TonB-dependent receptor [unclassified Sphingobacterium]MCS3556133.1 TonB-linked SusC/RagA family outer membrane protein [Sphingobacterium sp. JUb21]
MLSIETAKGQNLTLRFNDASLESVLSAIKKQGGYNFVINGTLLKESPKITVSVSSVLVDSALSAILQHSSLKYRIKGKTIILTKREEVNTSINVSQENISLSGTVVDSSGATLSGATIQVLKTSKWQGSKQTKTGADGRFTLDQIPADSRLLISFLGYTTRRIEATAQLDRIILNRELSALDEVLVVGYTTSTRQDNVASVVQVDAKDIARQNVSDLGDAIVGRLPGLTVTRYGGSPGESPVFDIRGQNTLSTSDNSPLLVIDGVPTNNKIWSALSPQDIESVSVIKDASAAVYGARAANGVILITTKHGKKTRPVLQYNGSVNLEYPTRLLRPLDSWQWATLFNEAQINDVRLPDGNIPQEFNPVYSPQDIQKFRDGSDPDHFPNTNWWEQTIRTPAVNQLHSLSIQGGGEQSNYFVSASYNNQGGLLRNVSNKRYTLRSNLDFKVNSNLNFGVDLSGAINDTKNPPGSTVTDLVETPPIYANQYASDPSKYGGYFVGSNLFRNPYFATINGDYNKSSESYVTAILRGEQKFSFIKGLSLKGTLSYFRNNSAEKNWRKNPVIHTDDGTYIRMGSFDGASLEQSTEMTDNLTFDAQFIYDRTLDKHHIKGLLLYNQTKERYAVLGADRYDFYSTAIDQINFGDANNQFTSGRETSNSRKSVVGQFGYRYDSRYLFDFTFRYDGSSSFLQRWGFFPALSAGWNIARESFMKEQLASGRITMLKLRASAGIVGNDRINQPYGYLDRYSLFSNALVIDDQVEGEVLLRGIGNTSITWEKEYSYNTGLDFEFWKGLLGGTLEIFYKKRSDILNTPSGAFPFTFGAAPPYENNSIVSNKGMELSLSHRHTIGGLSYTIRPNIAFSSSKIISIPEKQPNELLVQSGRTQDYYGFGLIALGLFQNAEDIAQSPKQLFGNLQPGDIKYADISGPDGKPDNVVDQWDRTRIGKPSLPRLQYGLGADFNFQSFDFSLFFQGVSRTNLYYSSSPGVAFTPFANTAYEHHLDRWTPDNTDGTYPRLSFGSANNTQQSTYWLHDASYLRLKSAMLGYQFNNKILQKAGFNSIRCYVAGYNLLTFDKVDIVDPEIGGGTYPLPKTFTFGMEVKF